MNVHFYIDNDADAERCLQSRQGGKSIAVGGTDTFTGRVRSYRGVVLSVEPVTSNEPGERFRITLAAE